MIFSRTERLLAWRYLRTKRAEGFISIITWFSLLGIMLGVATLIIVMSVMNGFRAELIGRILGLGGHVSVFDGQNAVYNYYDLAERLRQAQGVTSAVPVIEAQALITTDGQASGAQVKGISPEALLETSIVAEKMVAGNLDDFKDENIIIGERMAERLHLSIGDSLTLISPRSAQTAFGMIPRMRAYTVTGIFNVGMFEYDNGMVYMPLPAAQAFFRLPEGVTSIEVRVDDAVHVARYIEPIATAAGPKWTVQNWQQTNRSFFTALQVERNVMFVILSLIIMVAAFNIISSLVMMVKDKGRDIAILRTMGATRGSIMRTFFLAGATIGVVGTFAGLGLGILIATNIEGIRQIIQGIVGAELFSAEIYFLTQLPAKVDWLEVFQVVGMALVLAFLATLYPAWRAAKLDPVEALRYE